VLDLSGTKVRNVSALRGLENLSDLDLRDTEVRDVSPLRDLKSKRPDLTVEQPGLLGRGNDAVI
jgi:Leucine-rich repeat (LRR) protein